MRVCNFQPVLPDIEFQNGTRKPSQAVPGLALTMEQILKRIAGGSETLSTDDHNRIYDQPDRTINDYSPDVSRMTLAERAEVLANLRKTKERLTQRIEARKEQERIEKEAELRSKIEDEVKAKLSASVANVVEG